MSAAIPATLLGLVQRYSPSGQEGEAVAWLVAHMRALGFTHAFADEVGNAIGIMGAGSRQAVLLGHIDTVPGDIPVRVQAGNLYGRGSVDAKGPLAAFVDAVAAVGALPNWQFIVIGAVGEEADSRGAWHAAGRYVPALAIIGEPGGWQRVTLGYRGSLWLEYCVRRPMSHTASGDESACEAAVNFWDRLRALCAAYNTGRSRVFEQLSPTLRAMRSESDGFEERAALHIGVRLPPGITPTQWQDTLNALSGDGEVRILDRPVPAYRAEKNTALVRAFLAAIRAQGGAPAFVLKSGTSDMNIVGPVWSCPVLAYGPGDSALDHTPQEYLSLAEYHRAVQVLTQVLRSLGEEVPHPNPPPPSTGLV